MLSLVSPAQGCILVVRDAFRQRNSGVLTSPTLVLYLSVTN